MMSNLEHLALQVVNRMFIEVEASGRHVHLTKEQSQILFGCTLEPSRPLSQPGQFVSKQRVSIVGPKGSFANVAVLGPERKEGQVEISLTDAVSLGLTPPIRLSGQIQNTPGILLRGPVGELTLPCGVIVAQRHIHLDPESAKVRGLKDGDVVKVKMLTCRPVIFEDVVVRVHPSFSPRVHIDFDEANACAYRKGDWGMILRE